MTSGERVAETLRGAAALIGDRAGRAARALGLRPRAVSLALAEAPVPRTPLVAAAERALAPAPRWVLAHSMRTYLWGWLLGVRDGLRPDAELLLVASLLHDLGLIHRDGAACFALRGAELARAIVVAAGADASVAERVADAIARHLNVAPGGDVEARLVGAGAALDVVGARREHVAEPTRRAVVHAWPRDGFAASMADAVADESRRHPQTRIGFLCRRLGFLRLIADADAQSG
jgi:hypothetical protein